MNAPWLVGKCSSVGIDTLKKGGNVTWFFGWGNAAMVVGHAVGVGYLTRRHMP